MDKQELLKELNKIFIEVFDEEEILINENTTPDDIEDWDSLMQISLVTEIETRFKVKFKIEEVVNMNSVGEILNIVMKHLEE